MDWADEIPFRWGDGDRGTGVNDEAYLIGCETDAASVVGCDESIKLTKKFVLLGSWEGNVKIGVRRNWLG